MWPIGGRWESDSELMQEHQGTRNPTSARTKPGSGLRGPGTGFCFFVRVTAPRRPPPPSWSRSPPPGGQAGYKTGFNVRSCGSLLYLSPQWGKYVARLGNSWAL
jgi:hypothetical protein